MLRMLVVAFIMVGACSTALAIFAWSLPKHIEAPQEWLDARRKATGFAIGWWIFVGLVYLIVNVGPF